MSSAVTKTPKGAGDPRPVHHRTAGALDARALLALAVLYLVWGSTFLAMRVAVTALPPFGMGAVRFVCAGGLLLAIVRLRGGEMPGRRQWALAVPIGGLLFLIGNGLVMLAEKSIDSSIAAVVCATTPLLLSTMGAVFGERPSRAEVLGTVLGLLGVSILAFGSPLASSGMRGLYILVAPVGWALGSLVARRSGATGLGAAGAQMMCGGLWMLAASLLVGERVPGSFPIGPVLAWVYLVTCGSLVGFSAYIHLLRHTRPAVATSYAYVNPIVAVLLGAMLGGEHVGWPTLVATALIAAGVMTAVLLRTRTVAT